MGDDACCKTCGKYAGKEEPEPVERGELAVTMSKLKIVTSTGQEYIPTKETMIIGRATGADIQFSDGNISRRQACIVFREDGVYVKDLGSSCGTYVDGRKVAVGKVGNGSVIEMADYWLRIVER
jgi:pSer/pThr/pTyr-binding forkhead associated (FHA) protein